MLRACVPRYLRIESLQVGLRMKPMPQSTIRMPLSIRPGQHSFEFLD